MLILLGGATLRISISDTFLRYVKPEMRPFLLATGVLLVVLGVWALVDVIRSNHTHAAVALSQSAGPAVRDDVADLDHGLDDGHGHGTMRIAWLLLLPVLAILLLAPPALGSYTAEREDSVVVQPTDVSAFDPLPAGNPVAMLVSDYSCLLYTSPSPRD